MDIGVHNTTYLKKIFFSIVAIGIIVVVALPQNAYYGYSIVVGGLAAIILIIYEILMKGQENKNKQIQDETGEKIGLFKQLYYFLKILLTEGLPVFIVFSMMVWLMTITIRYKSLIEDGNVTQEYINFSNISSIMTLIQSVLLYIYLSREQKSLDVDPPASLTGKFMHMMAQNLGWLIVLMSVIHSLVIMIIQMNLEYFTTEGLVV